MSSDDKLSAPVEVARARNIFQARILAGLLESNGIPVLIPDEETIVLYDGAATIWEKGVRIEVPQDRAEEALEILALQAERAAQQPEEE